MFVHRLHQIRLLKAMLVYLVVVLFPTFAWAKTIIECGSSQGTSYRFEGGLVDKDHMGWGEDGIKDGQILFVFNGEDIDIQFKDAYGKFDTLKNQGFQIARLQTSNPNFISVIGVHTRGVFEHYLLKKSTDRAELLYYQSRFGDHPITSAKLMKADCKL